MKKLIIATLLICGINCLGVTNDETIVRTRSVRFIGATNNVNVFVQSPNTNINYFWEIWNTNTFSITFSNSVNLKLGGSYVSLSKDRCLFLRAIATNVWSEVGRKINEADSLRIGDSTNNTTIGTNGIVILNGAAVAWEDILQPASAAIKQGVTDITWDDTLAGQSYATTSTTNLANDHLTFTFQMPHCRKSNSDIYPHVHFWQSSASHTNLWYAYYSWNSIGATNTADVFLGPASNVATYVSGTLHQLASFPSISGSGKGISSVMRLKLHRDGNVGSGAVVVTDVDIHYQLDGFGSDSETSKSY